MSEIAAELFQFPFLKERLMDDGIDEDGGEDANSEQQPGFMASAWSFITTFFTSLIPEGPPQVGN